MKTRGRGYLKVFRRPYTENKAKRQEPEQASSTSNPERATKKGRTPEKHQEPTQTTKARFPQIGFWVVARFSFGTECSSLPRLRTAWSISCAHLALFVGPRLGPTWRTSGLHSSSSASSGALVEYVLAPAVSSSGLQLSVTARLGPLGKRLENNSSVPKGDVDLQHFYVASRCKVTRP